MKKTIIALASALILVGCTGQKTMENATQNGANTSAVVENEAMTGAYSKGYKPTEEQLALFKSTYQGSIELTPCSVSEQVVAGTNYAFTCKDGEGKEYIVTIFVPLPCNQDKQKTEVISIKRVK